MNHLLQELIDIQAELKSFFDDSKTTSILDSLNILENAANSVGRAWSKSWFGYQAYVYYEDFSPPPPGNHFNSEWGDNRSVWREYDPELVKNKIEEQVETSQLELAKVLSKQGKNLFDEKRDQVRSIIEVSRSQYSDLFLEEMLDQTKKLSIPSADTFVQSAAPAQAITRDEKVAGHGLWIPPHIAVLAKVNHLRSCIYANKQLLSIVQKLLFHIKHTTGREPIKMKQSDTLILNLRSILARFHLFAHQLRLRHDQRPTLSIQDEYDVQDLLHAILKLFIDDVRPEEVVPSYGGSSSRVDFLLKSEQIVVEAKIASAKLKDGKIGEQLIIDKNRYRSHPDCKTLICLIYDPHKSLSNPVGLENDLSEKRDEFEVIVIVTPK